MIVPTLARIIVREHLYKPITGKVIALGRQTVTLNYDNLVRLFKEEGCEPRFDIMEKVGRSLDKNTKAPEGHDFVSDDVFWAALGVENATSMDVSKYEGCGIVHDLNYPVPDSLVEQYDFILDGGTFDHLFDIKTAFQNTVKMLKTGGRIFQFNATSNFIGASYLSFGPDLFYDYYVLNQFDDCKVYIAEMDAFSQGTNWDFYAFSGDEYDHFRSKRIAVVLVLAEKGKNSTWDKFPIQGQYRDADIIAPYKAAQANIARSTRKELVGTKRVRSRAGLQAAMLFRRVIRAAPTGLKNRTSKGLQAEYCYVTRGKNSGFKYIGRI